MRFLRFIFRNHLRVATGLEPAARCCAGLNKLASGIGSGLIAALKAGTEILAHGIRAVANVLAVRTIPWVGARQARFVS
jgi:hypothetical protein